MFPYIETSQLICRANQLTGFYMMGTLVVKGLRKIIYDDGLYLILNILMASRGFATYFEPKVYLQTC